MMLPRQIGEGREAGLNEGDSSEHIITATFFGILSAVRQITYQFSVALAHIP